MKDYCTDKKFYKDYAELMPNKKRIFKQLSVKGTPLTKFAVAQFLQEARFAITIDAAILYSFNIDPKNILLTDKQKKRLKKQIQTSDQIKSKIKINERIRLLYDISQADFIQLLHKKTLQDPKFAAGTKVLAEIRSIIQDNSNNTPQQAILNITTTDKKTKKEKEIEKNSTTETPAEINRKPLFVVENKSINGS